MSAESIQFAEAEWLNEIIRYLPLYPPGYCLAWIVLALAFVFLRLLGVRLVRVPRTSGQ